MRQELENKAHSSATSIFIIIIKYGQEK